jgi:hypothetical protein
MNKNNFQKGFIIPLIIAIVVVLLVGGAYLVYKNESGQGEESDQINNQVNTTSTTSSSTSTTTQPAPVITSINPSSGPIGTIVELKGNNLAGFEGELDAWIENSKGEKAFLPGIGSVPRADQTIRVKIDSQLCKENLSYKGGPCSSYMTIAPGTYKIYTYPWGNMSNTVQFIVTASTSQVVNSQPSITIISPNGGESYTNTIPVRWTSQNIQGNVNLQFYYVNRLMFNVPSVPNTGSTNVDLAKYYTQSASANAVTVKICDASNMICDTSNQPFGLTFTN